MAIENSIIKKKTETGYNNINLKIFRNGIIIITGGLSNMDAEYCINLFLNKIKDFTMEIDINYIPLLKLFNSSSEYIKFIQTHYLVILKLFSHFIIDYDLKISKILVIDINEQIAMENLFSNLDDNDEDVIGYSKIIQIFILLQRYFKDDEIINYIENHYSLFYKFIDNAYYKENKSINNIIQTVNNQTIDLNKLGVTFFEKMNYITEVINYNSIYRSSLNINREIFTKILNKNYQKYIISSIFEPTSYQGINTKYYSKSLCPIHKDMDENLSSFIIKKNKSKSKIIYENVNNEKTINEISFDGEIINEEINTYLLNKHNKDVKKKIKKDKKIKDKKDKKDKLKNNEKVILDCDSGCSIISLLIFQNGEIMITGSNHWDKNLEGYEFIKGVLQQHKSDIVVNVQAKEKIINLPNKIFMKNSIFLNRKSIFESPRNVKILKELNILQNYKIHDL